MNFLETRIQTDGVVKAGNVLKVDSFLNHQIDISLIREMAYEWQRRFNGKKITKILTIEASGIALASIVAGIYNVPLLFAKKSKTINLDGELYHAEVESFTHKTTSNIVVSKKFLTSDDYVLIIDDFLANGCALKGLISLCDQAGAIVSGIGIAIEKGFQDGGKLIRDLGYQLESLAIIEAMDDKTGKITFRKN